MLGVFPLATKGVGSPLPQRRAWSPYRYALGGFGLSRNESATFCR